MELSFWKLSSQHHPQQHKAVNSLMAQTGKAISRNALLMEVADIWYPSEQSPIYCCSKGNAFGKRLSAPVEKARVVFIQIKRHRAMSERAKDSVMRFDDGAVFISSTSVSQMATRITEVAAAWKVWLAHNEESVWCARFQVDSSLKTEKNQRNKLNNTQKERPTKSTRVGSVLSSLPRASLAIKLDRYT